MQKRTRGFTLVELMLVVAIIGVLSSLAIPAFQRFLMRSKSAERDILVEDLRRGLIDHWQSNEYKFPEVVPGFGSYVNAFQNPPGAITSARKRFVKNQWGWDKLSFDPQGLVYFHYEVYAYDYPSFNFSMIYMYVYSDLDADNQVQTLYYAWERRPNSDYWSQVDFGGGQWPLRWGDVE